ncbi:leucyl aminopeptidase [Thioalkalivibrio sulfidiphilus]|uniref:leucyl aminopeptidase n=1 Tax=Thioalkalivibrio sulfidiphilus TaxID=1033854 RepID=UPI00036E342A|nr:leucyl aminopeptidase [Thioalkalivibrio sulfidiphilus]
MEFSVKSGNPEKQRSACVVVGVFDRRKLSSAARVLDKASGGALSTILRRGDMDGEKGQTLWLYNLPNTLCERVLLVGCGKERDFDEPAFRSVIATVAQTVNKSGAVEAVNYLTDLPVKGRDTLWKISQAVTITQDSLYSFQQLKSKKEDTQRPLKRIILSVPSRSDLLPGEEAVRVATAISVGTKLTRDLANLPGNICNPTYLAEQALQLKKTYKGLKVEVLEEADMEKLGMGALLSVSRGSEQPAKLITLEYRGGKKDAKPVVLVGKGITFDTGGISLKPGAEMDEMKFDMCGAASVLGVMKAVAEMMLPINLVGVVAAAENMPDGKATRPGDVVTSMSGQTIEILNTDAEGRLVLCDALSYVERFDPDVVIDIATLTGACIIALGHQATGLLSNHSPLANDLLGAGKQSYDRAWELPLWDEYQEQLKSNFADMANIGGRPAGTITAACFLSRFTKKYKWAHLDIAGVAWKSGKEKGATGRPVPLLMQYLLNKAA